MLGVYKCWIIDVITPLRDGGFGACLSATTQNLSFSISVCFAWFLL
jgi:hypothetical protein